MDIVNLKAWEIIEKLNNKELSTLEVLTAYLDNIASKEKEINSFIELNDNVIEKAKEIDLRRSKGDNGIGILSGVPVAVKDNIVTKDLKTTCGSKMLESFVPPYNAHVIDRLDESGGLLIGKTNMDEFAMGSSSESSYFGPTKNPIDTKYTAGGSSSGSAAAVAAGFAPISIGTDTGGSIRQPASFCNLVGIKPTYGMVSRYGVVSVVNTLDQVGVFGKDVKDAHLMLEAIKGYDKRDATSSKKSNENIDLDNLSHNLKGLKVAIPKEYLELIEDNELKNKFEESIKVFEDEGAIIEYVSLPNLKYAVETYTIISSAEISANMSRFDGIRFGHRTKEYETLDELYKNTRAEGFGLEVKNRIITGTYYLSSSHAGDYYNRALKVRTLIIQDFDNVFKDFDVILSLVSPKRPYLIGDETINNYEVNRNNIFTVPVNLAGLCAMSIPAGFVDGLPVGLQIIGDRFREDSILRAGLGFEKAVLQ